MAVIRKAANLQRLINEQRPKIKPDDIDGVLDESQVPDLNASKITFGIFNVSRIPQLPASRISSGTFTSDRLALKLGDIPKLPARWIDDGEFDLARIPSIDLARVPDLPASKLTSGVLNLARIPSINEARVPNLSASKITSGTFSAARIPNLSASKITSGVIGGDRLPSDAGGVKTYAFLRLKDTAPSEMLTLGATVAGSLLEASNVGLDSGGSMSGTWRVMGYVHGDGDPLDDGFPTGSATPARRTTVFLRVA